jgi:hypothetical protein
MTITTMHLAGRQGLAAIPSLALVIALPALIMERGVDVRRSLRIVDVGHVLDAADAELAHAALLQRPTHASRAQAEARPFCRLAASDDDEMSSETRSYGVCATTERRCDAPRFAPTPLALPAPSTADERVLTYILDGDLHIDSPRTLAFELVGLKGREVNVVVLGDVYIADDVYLDDGKLRIYALKDHTRGRGGDIVLGDAHFGTLAHVEADLVAAGRIRRLPGAEAASIGRVAVEGVPLTMR